MTGLFNKKRPSFHRVLLIESGTRTATERFLKYVYQLENCGQVDLLTCFSTPPQEFQSGRGKVFLVTDPAIAAHRQQFLRTITGSPYDIVAMLHTGGRILYKWKWIVALLTRAKILLVPEDRDFVFVDYSYFTRFKVNMPRLRREQVTGIRLAGEALLVPFVVLYLLLYAGGIHFRRLLRG